MSHKGEYEGWTPGRMIKFLPYLLPLTLESSVAYVKLKWNARKAKKIFMEELEASGIEHETAAYFADIYLSPSRMLGTLLGRS